MMQSTYLDSNLYHKNAYSKTNKKIKRSNHDMFCAKHFANTHQQKKYKSLFQSVQFYSNSNWPQNLSNTLL